MAFRLTDFLFRKSNSRNASEAHSKGSSFQNTCIRIAVYDNMTSEPRIIDIESEDIGTLISQTSDKVHAECKKNGGEMPYTVIREVIENLIHANFQDSVVSVSPDGREISISDHGPGILDKLNAFLPGFTTATLENRRYIKGVGSGLPVARETIEVLGGTIKVDDNLGKGAVVTISLPGGQAGRGRIEPDAAIRTSAEVASAGSASASRRKPGNTSSSNTQKHPRETKSDATREIVRSSLSERQRKLMILAAELGEIGPSIASKELEMSLSTVFRDLVALEDLHLLQSIDGGKRKLTEQGIEVLEFLMD